MSLTQNLATLFRKVVGRIYEVVIHGSFIALESLSTARDDYWCFCTWTRHPHTLDNPRAVFEEVKHDDSIRKIILQKVPSEVPPDGTNVKVVPAESLAGAYYLARSRVVILGYALRGITSYSHWLRGNRHHVIQLWHGIPLKRIGHLFPDETIWGAETGKYSATVCSSSQDREIMSKAFAPIPIERVWLTGLPRNDIILKQEEELPGDYRVALEDLDERITGRRLVLYAPTWRERRESIYSFSEEEQQELSRLLQKAGAVLAIRGHANVRHHGPFAEGKATNEIVPVDHIPEANLLLRRAALLITDYSSIYIDYLLLDRPIVHFAYDVAEYREERGFLYDLEEAFAGPCARSFEDLLTHMEEALKAPNTHVQKRSNAYRLFHQHGSRPAAKVAMRIRALSEGEPRVTA